MYAIKNEHGEFYTGDDYYFQGEKYAVFARYREEYKKYKSLIVAEKVKMRLELSCNGFDKLKIVEIEDTLTAMKPLDIKDENLKCNGGNPLYGEWITGTCPKCKQDVQLGMNYCPNCGQKLLWENEEKRSNI